MNLALSENVKYELNRTYVEHGIMITVEEAPYYMESGGNVIMTVLDYVGGPGNAYQIKNLLHIDEDISTIPEELFLRQIHESVRLIKDHRERSINSHKNLPL